MSGLRPLTHAYSWACILWEGMWNWNLPFKSQLRHNLNPPPGPRTWDKLNYLLQTHFIKMTLVPNKHQREKSTKCIHCLRVSGRWWWGWFIALLSGWGSDSWVQPRRIHSSRMAAVEDNQAWESGNISYQFNDPFIVIYPSQTPVSLSVTWMLFNPQNMAPRKQETEEKLCL